MIIVVTTIEYSKTLRRNVRVISHGYDTITNNNVIMSCEPLDYVDYVIWNNDIGEFIVREDK